MFAGMAEGQAQSVKREIWGEMADGHAVERVTLENSRGLRASMMTYGATLLSIETPDREGRMANVTLSLASFADYEKGHPLLGSIVGRYANRIAGGGFRIDGVRYDLQTVNRRTGVHIHGGSTGFQKQLWTVQTGHDDEAAWATFSLNSANGHEGFPGSLEVQVTYRLDNGNALTLDYFAESDRPTHVNLTNHVYFNLGGGGSGDILEHRLQIDAQEILEFDGRKIPTGKTLAVQGTPFDFREPRAIGAAIADLDGGGYDHCYVINGGKTSVEAGVVASLLDPRSGRTMTVKTSKPGLQLYTANHLKAALKSPQGQPYGPHHGVCLETQFFPDSPNRSEFPSSLLRPGESYRHRTVFAFGLEGEK